MTSISRRDFVRGAAAVPLSFWLLKYAGAQEPRVRYDARSPKGQEMLKIYAGAVKSMQALAATDPSNWTFQWYTHFVKGSTTKSAEISRIFGPAPSPHKDLALAMWNTCQAHSGQNENLFLPWHRMFVLAFENIVRAVSQRNDFTLPYWNYSVSGPTHGVLPDQFRMKDDPVFGPLYVAERNSLANAGKPIDQGQPNNPLGLQALNQPQYSPSGALQGFCLALDSGLHGNVHVLTGNTQNMGAVPWAARDPIFWLHHCNIDRLWASWNANGGVNPKAPWNDDTFVFADPKGNRVVAKVSDYFNIRALGYSYDRLEPKPSRSPFALAAASASSRKPQRTARVSVDGGVALGAAPVRVQLDTAGMQESAPPLSQTLQLAAKEQRAFLVLSKLEAQVQPEVLYHVYLELPEGTTPEKGVDYYVGTLTFFDALKLDHGDAEHSAHTGGEDKFYSFDVTDLLRRLRVSKVLGERPSVTIAPVGEPASAAKAVVGTIELQMQ
ncbi:MAG: tyrosinase family protein [Rhodanobacteraceae bacterium]|nr:tyrosinase family protein [Rhodanobacteraceae bacterium]